MAFGDKLPKFTSAKSLRNTGKVEIIELADVVSKTKAVVEPVNCCDDSYNFSVEHGTGVPFCLKCHKPMNVEHFNAVLNAYAERMKEAR